jgi:hypothetical protein
MPVLLEDRSEGMAPRAEVLIAIPLAPIADILINDLLELTML